MILQKEAIIQDEKNYLDRQDYEVSTVKADLSRKIAKIEKKSRIHSLSIKVFLAGAAILLGVQAFSPRTVDITDIADRYHPTLTLIEKVESVELVKKVIPAEVKSESKENKEATPSKESLQKARDIQAQKDLQNLSSGIASWAEGSLGKIIALMALMIGAAISVVKCSPMPAITGVALAMFLNFGPTIILQITGLHPAISNTEVAAQEINTKQPSIKKPKDKIITEEVKSIKEVERKIALTASKLQCFIGSSKDCLADTNYSPAFKALVTKSIKDNSAYTAYYSLISSKTEKEFNEKLNSWNYQNQSAITAESVDKTKKDVNEKFNNIEKSSIIRHLTLPVIFLLCVSAFYSRRKRKESEKNKAILQKIFLNP